MFVFSFKLKGLKRFIPIVIVGVAVLVIVALVMGFGVSTDSSDKSRDFIKGNTPQERMDFIEGYGWQVDEKPLSERNIVIPGEFDEVYLGYNEIQLDQGFDLTEYATKSATVYTYRVRNYPGFTGENDYICLNLMVCEGVIIGGDVCSTRLDGFMHGFDRENI